MNSTDLAIERATRALQLLERAWIDVEESIRELTPVMGSLPCTVQLARLSENLNAAYEQLGETFEDGWYMIGELDEDEL